MMTDQEMAELIHDIGVIYSSQEFLAGFLKGLSEMSMTYAGQTQPHIPKQAQNDKEQQRTSVAM